jgi:hypothetical protein
VTTLRHRAPFTANFQAGFRFDHAPILRGGSACSLTISLANKPFEDRSVVVFLSRNRAQSSAFERFARFVG